MGGKEWLTCSCLLRCREVVLRAVWAPPSYSLVVVVQVWMALNNGSMQSLL